VASPVVEVAQEAVSPAVEVAQEVVSLVVEVAEVVDSNFVFNSSSLLNFIDIIPLFQLLALS